MRISVFRLYFKKNKKQLYRDNFLIIREIKFKAKRVSDGEWVEGSYLNLFNEKKGEHTHEIAYQLFEGASMDYPYPTCYTLFDEIDPSTLCQFTGLTDKNGVEIYEGDIFRIHEGKDDFKETHLIWDNDWCLFVPSNSELRHRIQSKHSEHYEVIGNIHNK